MKTKITTFPWLALLCASIFVSGAFADTESGFYEKDHIRGFISIGADYRGMFKEFQNYVNARRGSVPIRGSRDLLLR